MRVLLSCLLLTMATAQAAPPGVIHLPPEALVPDAVADAHGTLHLVYGTTDKQAYYAQSTDNGGTFTPRVKLNDELGVTTTMGERGPKLALGADGEIHVVWQDLWKPGVQTYVRYTRSLDGGRTFAPPQAASPMPGCDGATLAADAQGHVAVFWHVMAEPKPVEKQATWLYGRQSSDHGATFGDAARLAIDGLSSVACSMCLMRAHIADGMVDLCFRSAADDIRDFWVLRAPVGQNQFRPVRVNDDRWQIDFCPMCGPEMTAAPDGGWLVAFMSRHRVYWSAAPRALDAFAGHVATPAPEADEIYPCAVRNRHGDVLFVWQVGPMAVDRTATVKWALYAADGKPTGEAGVFGQTTSGTKPTAFVGADDRFYVLTTAR